MLKRLDHRCRRLAESNRRRIEQFERAGSILVLAIAIAGTLPLAREMATTSLWNDELYTIQEFSGRGLATALTDYHAPNNHILFNAVNSILPGSGSVEPYRARLLSFVACLTALGVLVTFLGRRGRLFEAALIAAVLFRPGMLSLGLQARGYGFLLLFATVASLAVVELFRRPSRTAAAALAAATLLGTWTVPTFLLFAGPLMLVAWLFSRDRRVLFAGIAAALAIALLYLPLREELWSHSQGYARIWGRRYASFDAVAQTVQRFLVSAPPWMALLTLGATLLAPGLVTERRSPIGRALRALTLAIVVFFAACLWLETPLVRTTAFVVVPMVFVLVLAASELYRAERSLFARPLVVIVAVLIAANLSYSKLTRFSFTPLESWKATADTIESLFPDDLPLHSDFRPHFLRAYLKPVHLLEPALDPERFADGRQVLANTGRDQARKRELRQAAASHALLSFPELYGGEQLVLFRPPPSSCVAKALSSGDEIRLEPLIDRSRDSSGAIGVDRSGEPTLLRMELEPGIEYRSVIVLFSRETVPDRVEVAAFLDDPGEDPVRVESRLGEGGLLTVALGDRQIGAIEIRAWPPGASETIRVDELWAYPAHRLDDCLGQ